jgi:starch synthase (maltosyl-transferring)
MAPSAAPRILFALAGELSQQGARAALLSEAAELGFTHLLIGAAFAQNLRGGGRDLTLLGDTRRADPLFGEELADQALKTLVKQANAADLKVMLDVPLERVAEHAELLAALTGWRPPRDQPLNPRAPGFGQIGVFVPWRDAAIGAVVLQQFEALLIRLAKLGVAGVRLIGIHAPFAGQLKQLLEALRLRQPSFSIYAETEGVPSHVVAELKGAAFSGALASLPWWDFREPWFFDEYQLISQLGRVLMPVSASHLNHAAFDRRDAQRRALVAGGLGDGVIFPVAAILEAREHGEVRDALAKAFSLCREPHGPTRLNPLSAPWQPITVVERQDGHEPFLIAINSSAEPKATPVELLTTAMKAPTATLAPIGLTGEHTPPVATVGGQLVLGAAQVGFFRALGLAPVVAPPANRQTAKRLLDQAIAAPRVVIEAVSPSVDQGAFAIRANAGGTTTVEADVYCDGHDPLAVRVQWRALDDVNWHENVMTLDVNDRFSGSITLERLGSYEFRVVAYVDRFATWLYGANKKRAAGLDLTLEVSEGSLLVEAFAEHSDNKALKKLAEELKQTRRNPTQAYTARLEALFNPATKVLMEEADPRHHATTSALYPVHAERRAAHYASWYELFPRSMSVKPGQHGSFFDVIDHLPRVAAMGFDVLYLLPIHPIGTAHRKGRNNSLTPAPDDPGSPYAIGSPDGGHDAVHPELGTLEDFLTLVKAASQHGLEIALDFAIQCSPDHPWLKQHPEWFRFRPDGSLPYAENPPKKYEDIVNVDFYTDRLDSQGRPQAPALWSALRDIVLFWAERGVRIFRVDNPHTKPLPFWQWMIGDVTAQYPDVLFLAEAFTAPKMMARLAKVGFTQSYTYFTWRNSKYELTTYLNELNQPPLSDVYRPHFFVNTPDINPVFLQSSGRAGFLIRAALATMLSGLWGMYSGFELCEAEPVPGKEEYLDSEKYQLRQRDFASPGNIIAEITQLNRIRQSNPALHSHLGVTFYQADNDQILYFAKATASRDNVVLVAINLDFRNPQSCEIELPLWEWGLDDSASMLVEDLVEGHRFSWHGKRQRLTIDPNHRPYNIWRVTPPSA